MHAIREPAVAGMFYSAGEKKLREQLESLFDNIPNKEKFICAIDE